MSSDQHTILDFNRVLQDIAQALFGLVKAKIGPSAAWQQAILDVRSPEVGGMQMAKFRITVLSEAVLSAQTTDEIDDLIMVAWGIKRTAFPEQWFGLKLVILPSGECETDFNYDPASFDASDFLDL